MQTNSQTLPRPVIEALDRQGFPYEREALYVGELPHDKIRLALDSAVERLEAEIGRKPSGPLKYGLPVHTAFGMTRPQAKNHSMSKLLLTPAAELSLDYCAVFSR